MCFGNDLFSQDELLITTSAREQMSIKVFYWSAGLSVLKENGCWFGYGPFWFLSILLLKTLRLIDCVALPMFIIYTGVSVLALRRGDYEFENFEWEHWHDWFSLGLTGLDTCEMMGLVYVAIIRYCWICNVRWKCAVVHLWIDAFIISWGFGVNWKNWKKIWKKDFTFSFSCVCVRINVFICMDLISVPSVCWSYSII